MIAIDDAEPFDAVRRELMPAAVAAGIPFHVTLLSPFGELVDEARAFFAEQRPFDFALTRVASWPDVLYLVPEPSDDLQALMRTLHAEKRLPITDEGTGYALEVLDRVVRDVAAKYEEELAPAIQRWWWARERSLAAGVSS